MPELLYRLLVLLAENEEEAQLRNENASLNSQINAQQTKLSQAKEIHSTLQSKVHSITQSNYVV